MSIDIKEQSRFNTRLPREQKELFERAATLGGYRNLTDFILQAVQEKAQKIVTEREQIIASDRDSMIFFNAVINPSSPTEELKKALDAYNGFIGKAEGSDD